MSERERLTVKEITIILIGIAGVLPALFRPCRSFQNHMKIHSSCVFFLLLTSILPSVAEEYHGKVGKLDAVFDIEWGGDNSVGGIYYYPSRKGVTYTLEGEFGADDKLILREYTEGKITAVMILSHTGGEDNVRWSGKMKNTDGREFDMWFGE